jgi:hypothetical protein
MPPRPTTKSFHAVASSVVSAGSFQYRPPQELLMIFAPALASCASVDLRHSPGRGEGIALAEPSSVGGLSR